MFKLTATERRGRTGDEYISSHEIMTPSLWTLITVYTQWLADASLSDIVAYTSQRSDDDLMETEWNLYDLGPLTEWEKSSGSKAGNDTLEME